MATVAGHAQPCSDPARCRQPTSRRTAGGWFAMTNPTTSKPVVLAEYMAKIWVRMLRRSGAIAEDASQKMAAGKYGYDDYVRSVRQLVDGNLLDGMELAETLLAGPGFKSAANVARSDPYRSEERRV